MALATGAGKTFTSLYGITKMLHGLKRLFVIIAVPYQNLAEQWCNVAREFNIHPIQCYENTEEWKQDLTTTTQLFNSKATKFACAVVVNRTLQSSTFQTLIEDLPGDRLLFIGDECHHHTSQTVAKALPQQAAYRLGLSATPEHAYNERANQRLRDYYGTIVSTYTLAQALTDNVLTPYEYYVHPVLLNREEADEYFDLTKRISTLLAQQDDVEGNDNPYLESLLIARARLLGSAHQKLRILDDLLATNHPTPLTLFYCGDGRVTDEVNGEESRQIDAVTQLLFERGWKTCQFTTRESLSTRRTILDNFRIGAIKKSTIQVKMLRVGAETHVLCVSSERKEKDRAIGELHEKRLLADLEKLTRRVAKNHGKGIKPAEVGESIGRLKERYSPVVRYYRMDYDEVKETFEAHLEKDKRAEAEKLDGSYLLKTDRQDLSAEEAWRIYTLLTKAEAAFRTLKSPLEERPIFHHKECRVEAHIFLCVLAYHLLMAIEKTLLDAGVHTSWATVREQLKTHQVNTIILPTDNGMALHIRKATTPEPIHQELYQKPEAPGRERNHATAEKLGTGHRCPKIVTEKSVSAYLSIVEFQKRGSWAREQITSW